MLPFHYKFILCVYTWDAHYHGTHVIYRGRGQLLGVSSLLSLCRSQELNSNHQAWWQTPLTSELFGQPKKRFLKCSLICSFTTFIHIESMGAIYLNLEIIQRQML